MDIKPGSCPSPLNLKSNGVVPVSILGSDAFDVNNIDITSIRLAGVAPVRSNYEDAPSPVVDGNECECSTEGQDGFADLTLKFKAQETIAELATEPAELYKDNSLILKFTGSLTDGTAVEGKDGVVVIGKVPTLVAAEGSLME